MLGTIINAAAIVIGGIAGLSTSRRLSAAAQNNLKLALGCVTIFYGMKLAWTGFNGSFGQIMRQFAIVLLALMFGRVIGRLLHLQKLSNRLGQEAREGIARTANRTPAWTEGFNTCTALFCAAPLAVIGSVSDGLGDYFVPLAIKGVMDGLAAFSFVSMFRWSVLVAALPVFVYQGVLTLACMNYAKPYLDTRNLLDIVLVTDGFLMVFVSLVIFEVRKIELADYLPALAVAPLIAWFWH